jgi:valyl-tRNA synthetase
MQGMAPSTAITNPLDKALLAALADVVDQSTKAFEQFNYTKALEQAETFFWAFTDDHVEIVKDRAYGLQGQAEADSAKATLNIALETLLKLFAPFLPFVTEEVWAWWQEGSVHTSSWPTAAPLRDYGGDSSVLAVTAEVISQLRKVKSEAKVSMKAEISKAVISAPAEVIAQIKLVATDLRAAGRVNSDFVYVESKKTESASPTSNSTIQIEIELAPASS